MKKLLTMIITTSFLLTSLSAHALLWNRGNGMIYDDVQDVTWLQDTNWAETTRYPYASTGGMSWEHAKYWVDNLVYAEYGNWRLPDVTPQGGGSFNLRFAYDGSTDRGYNITSPASELAYMFHVNLGNKSIFDADANLINGGGFENASFANGGDSSDLVSFINLGRDDRIYWYGVQAGPEVAHLSWLFDTFSGAQGFGASFPIFRSVYVWPVADGDIVSLGLTGEQPIPGPIPVPAAIWLFGSGLIGLVAFGRKRLS